MRVTPVLGGAQTSLNPNEGQSVSPERLARAKAVALGKDAPAPAQADPQASSVDKSVRRLRMRTQMSPDRHNRVEQETAPVPPAAAATDVSSPGLGGDPVGAAVPAPQGDSLAPNEPSADPASDATKPLSPQFAALARQKRAIQLKEQEIAKREEALKTQPNGDLESFKARIKTNALSVLLEEGVTYDQLTEQILAQNQNGADLSALRNELKAEIKAELDNQNKALANRDATTEKQVLAQIGREADRLVASGGDAYEMIREAGYSSKIVDLIHRTHKETGELMDTKEAADLIENELLEDSLKFARLKKVQNKLAPPPEQPGASVQQDRPGTKTMRTLTNRDGASSLSMSKRERAIAAMEGRLTK